MRVEHYGRSAEFALVALAFVAGEILWRTRIARRGYDGGEALASLGLALGNVASGALHALVLGGAYAAASGLAPVHWSMGDWRVWIAGFVAVEFVYYWVHRMSHEVRWMWASHAVHHSPQQLTFLSAVRLSWTALLSGGWLFYLPLVVAGFDPRMIVALLAFDLHYQFFLHTEAIGKLGPLEWVLNTPMHHRVHHASNAEYLDCNYGGVVIVFDRLFGTFVAERKDVQIRYGLADPLGTLNPFKIAFGEWRRMFRALRGANGLRDAVSIAMGRP